MPTGDLDLAFTVDTANSSTTNITDSGLAGAEDGIRTHSVSCVGVFKTPVSRLLHHFRVIDDWLSQKSILMYYLCPLTTRSGPETLNT